MAGDLLECLNIWLNFTMLPSEVTTFRTLPFAAQGGTLEDASVAQAVNDVLLTSHGYGLRLFPIWSALRPTQSAIRIVSGRCGRRARFSSQHSMTGLLSWSLV